MQVEDGLARALADVHEHVVVVQALLARDVGDELEHPLRLVGGERVDVAEGLDVALGEDEQVDVRLRVDVADGDEALGACDVIAVAEKGTEEAVLRQRGSPPP